MLNQAENATYVPLENCSSIAKDFVLNLNDSKSGTIFMVFDIVLNVVLMLTASLGNGIIIVAILSSQNLQTPSYLLITSLSFTDILIGLVYYPLHIVLIVYNFKGNIQGVCRMASFYLFVSAYLGFTSLLMVTCIGIDRYMALTLRHQYNIIVTKKRVRLLILSVWIATFFASFPAVAIEGAFNAIYIFGSCLYSVLLLTTCVFYIKSYRALHLYTVQVQAQQPNPSAGNFDIVRYKKTLKTMLLVLVCFGFCCFPLIVTGLTRVAVGPREELRIAFNVVSFTLVSLNCSINPVIYLIRFRDIRSACRETLTRLVELNNH